MPSNNNNNKTKFQGQTVSAKVSDFQEFQRRANTKLIIVFYTIKIKGILPIFYESIDTLMSKLKKKCNEK